jgi:hypothetical protein
VKGPGVPALIQELQRTSREVDAWGCELKDACALAAVEEAYRLLDSLRPSPGDPLDFDGKAAAIMCVQARHHPGIDHNGIVRDLKQAVFSSISRQPPLRPLTYSVGLLPMDEDSFSAWARLTPQCLVQRTTLAPLLVIFAGPSDGLGALDLIGYLRHVASAERLDVTCEGPICAAIIPIQTQHIGRLQSQSLGPPLRGDMTS